MVLGSDGLRILEPHDLGAGLEVMVALGVALILFEGGLNLKLRDLRQVSQPLRNLVTVGAGLTWLGASLTAHVFVGLPWSLALLYGSLVTVTGPTVVNPILKRVRLEESFNTLIEGEGVLIDPLGAILAVVVLQVLLNRQTNFVISYSTYVGQAIQQGVSCLVIGILVGGVGGWCLGSVLRWSRSWFSDEIANCVALSVALGLYGMAQRLWPESGLMAVVVAGLLVRQFAPLAERAVRQFHSQLVVLVISVLFILLSAELSLQSIVALGWQGIATVGILMLVVRPFSILVSTWGSDLSWQQKVFLAWLAPRGIVAASVASLFALVLTNQGIDGGEKVCALVYLTIAMTVILQGLSAFWVAKWLGLVQPQRTLIIGGHSLARSLAELLQTYQLPVQIVSVLPGVAMQTGEVENREEDEAVSLQSLDKSALVNRGIETVDQVLIMTRDPQINWAIAELAQKLFPRARVRAALLPDTPLSDGIQPIHVAVAQLRYWIRTVDKLSTEVVEIHLPKGDQKADLLNFTESLTGLKQDIANYLCFPLALMKFPPANHRFSHYSAVNLELLPDPQTWQPGDVVFVLKQA
jgi:NhaP-type Na+/H+ or K+/H+ antiporter